MQKPSTLKQFLFVKRQWVPCRSVYSRSRNSCQHFVQPHCYVASHIQTSMYRARLQPPLTRPRKQKPAAQQRYSSSRLAATRRHAAHAIATSHSQLEDARRLSRFSNERVCGSGNSRASLQECICTGCITTPHALQASAAMPHMGKEPPWVPCAAIKS